jgi:large subunit ribosomal protein L9
VLIRASSNSGQLYGSVSVRDIAVALAEKGHQVDKRQVILSSPIKTLGVFEVTIALHPEVRVTVKVNVARSEDEAELQSQGVDVMAQMADEDRDVGGFTEAFDPNRELGELPTEATDEDEAA